jgi:hypothetical protein
MYVCMYVCMYVEAGKYSQNTLVTTRKGRSHMQNLFQFQFQRMWDVLICGSLFNVNKGLDIMEPQHLHL